MAPLPDWIEPMLATLTDERDLGDGWVLERKLDGIRCLALVRGGRVTLLSRTRKPLSFPAVSDALGDLREDAIIDGEVVAVALSEILDGPSRAAYQCACSEGWEGIIAKRAAAPYRAGRSRDRLKLKCLFEQEMVIGGVTQPPRPPLPPRAPLGRHYEGRARRH